MPERTQCPSCYGLGEWETECCSGAGGCSCQGGLVSMGRCLVCHGSGEIDETADLMANANWLMSTGACFVGTGPRSLGGEGIYDRMPRLGYR